MSLFFLSLAGCVLRKNILAVLMCLNVLIGSVCLFFVALSRYYPNSPASVIALIVMMIGALLTVLGLGAWRMVLKKRETENVDELNVLRD